MIQPTQQHNESIYPADAAPVSLARDRIQSAIEYVQMLADLTTATSSDE
jgi:hypothetical protein